MTRTYEAIAKSHWRDHESDCEHADRVETCANEANIAYAKACAGPLAVYHQAMADIRPYSGSPRWDRLRAAASRIYQSQTAAAYELFLREFEELMRDGETSEATSFAWDAYFAGQRERVAA